MKTRLLSATVLALPALLWPSADRPMAAEADEVRLHESALAELESRFGPYDASLLEPLEGLEAAWRAQGDDERVREIQARRLQVTRAALGLEHPDVAPVLEALAATAIRRGEWDEVTDHLRHLRSLAASAPDGDDGALLDAMDRLAVWHLQLVHLGPDRDRADHFMEARDLRKEMLEVAEARYGEGDPALAPWLYRRARSLARLVELLNADDGVASDAIEEAYLRDGPGRLESPGRGGLVSTASRRPGNFVPVVVDGEPVGAGYLRQARGLIDDIRDIAEAEGDGEAWAMATLHRGDLRTLGDIGTGRRDYRRARDRLIGLGFDAGRVDRALARPVPIPMETLFTRFADYEAHLRAAAASGPPGDGVFLGGFTAWEEGLASMPRPANPHPLLAVERPHHQVELSFRVSARGRVSSVEALSAAPPGERVEREGRRAARGIRFRPALRDGRPRPVDDARMLYRYAPDPD